MAANSSDPATKARRRAGALAALLAGTLLVAIVRISPSRSGGPSTVADVSRALSYHEENLTAARRQMAEHPDDGAAALRVASLAWNRASMLAQQQRERSLASARSASESGGTDEARRRSRFLRTDPAGLMTEVSVAASASLRCRLAAEERSRAVYLLAGARAALGDHAGEVAAIEEATRMSPDDARLWSRLANAYARARRFRLAQAAHARALALDGR